MRKIALQGEDRIAWSKLRGKASQTVSRAVKNGMLKDLKKEHVKCIDCGARAANYDHRDYNKPLDVDPVCRGCNIIRGSNAPTLKEESRGPRCVICGSFQVLYRQKDDTYGCRVCGNRWLRVERKGSQTHCQNQPH